MFGNASEHLRIRVGLYTVHEPWTAHAIRELRSFIEALPARYAIHAVVLGIALTAAAVAAIGG